MRVSAPPAPSPIWVSDEIMLAAASVSFSGFFLAAGEVPFLRPFANPGALDGASIQAGPGHSSHRALYVGRERFRQPLDLHPPQGEVDTSRWAAGVQTTLQHRDTPVDGCLLRRGPALHRGLLVSAPVHLGGGDHRRQGEAVLHCRGGFADRHGYQIQHPEMSVASSERATVADGVIEMGLEASGSNC